MTFPKLGEIWLVCFDPSVGTEYIKTRPALILSNDVNNEVNKRVTLLPITGDPGRPISFTVLLIPDAVNNLHKPSIVRPIDITTFDKSRLIKKIGDIDNKSLTIVREIVIQHLNLTL
ncbi:MAG: type II toxin-antitoxin system PemK/MazF family toxin [Cyanobacteriota bacterium]